MKNTHTTPHIATAALVVFSLTFGAGYGAGSVAVESMYNDGSVLQALILRTSSASSQSSRRMSPAKKRVMRGVQRKVIVRPSTRRNTGSTVTEGGGSVSRGPIKASCGDKLVLLKETCDDGNTISGDGCSSACAAEAGYTCYGQPSECFAVCGDGTKAAVEKCDDGNGVGGDGCSASCKVEANYTCTGSTPSSCEITPYCGDGIKASTEQCDDGNGTAGDGCNACKTE